MEVWKRFRQRDRIRPKGKPDGVLNSFCIGVFKFPESFDLKRVSTGLVKKKKKKKTVDLKKILIIII